jgi:hypothetical protein
MLTDYERGYRAGLKKAIDCADLAEGHGHNETFSEFIFRANLKIALAAPVPPEGESE